MLHFGQPLSMTGNHSLMLMNRFKINAMTAQGVIAQAITNL